MPRIGIIVDGQGDYHSLRTRFVGSCQVLKTDGPRGHTVSINKLVSGAGKQLSMLMDCGCNEIVVIVDFEMRMSNYDEFVRDLVEQFTRNYTQCQVHVAVPNRMIENWYLADISYLSQLKVYLKNNLQQRNYEGLHGKDELKRCFAHGYTYSETTHGPQMFRILRFDVARRNSDSLNVFLSIMETISSN